MRRECLEAALADPELIGLWGGTTEAERRETASAEWRREQRATTCNSDMGTGGTVCASFSCTTPDQDHKRLHLVAGLPVPY